MEENQQTLENQSEETRPQYRYICSNTAVGFLNLLNENHKDGYKLFKDIELGEVVVDAKTLEKYQMRQAYLYDSEATGIDADETGERLKIIDAVIDAEDYLYRKKSLLEDRENYLTLNTPWDAINNARKSKGLPKISNEKQRNAYLNQDKQLETLRVEVHEGEQYLKLVKKYAELHKLPQRESPWEIKAREAEEQAQIEDEQASEVYVEKIGTEEAKEEGL